MNRQGSILSAWGGHLADLWRLVRFDVRNPHSYSKFRQLRAMGRRSGARVLIETGTFLGNTAMRCSRCFDQVITIELSPELHRQASQYLAGRSNVECIAGEAIQVLPQILRRENLADALVFLDAHYSGFGTAHGDETAPACREVQLLAQHKEKIAGLVIDDFRLFGVESGWPRKSELLRAIEENFDDFEVAVHLDQVLAWRPAQHRAAQKL